MEADDAPSIADYAFLGDCYSTALVDRRGAIDWACLQRFDAPSCCARLLDRRRGGHLAVGGVGARPYTRRYRGQGSLVLATDLDTPTGRLRVTDAFAMRDQGPPLHLLLRVVDALAGRPQVQVELAPRFEYGAVRPWLRRHGERCWSATGAAQALVVTTDVPLAADRQGHRLHGRLPLEAGQRVRVALSSQHAHLLDARPLAPEAIDAHLQATVRWWDRWSAGTRAQGAHAGIVRQSAAVLKGLTCAPTGAIIAAPTTSLPERVGGGRNWDYRFSWVRDATMTVDTLLRLGHAEVASGYRDFLMRSSADHCEDLQILFGCYGEHDVFERELDLAGYRGSQPVRIGNGAARQVQQDVYGHILSAAERWHRADGRQPDEDEWRFLAGVADAAAGDLHQPGHGLWEVRGQPQQFTHSKVLLWAALTSALRLARARGEDPRHGTAWGQARRAVRDLVDRRGVADGGWFTQQLDGRTVDAALLRLPRLGFVDAGDERMRATVQRIRRDLTVGDGRFLLRYDPDRTEDGVDGPEHAFLMCSFWLVEVLVAQGERAQAEQLFAGLLDAANDLGLYSEEYDPGRHELLGNFPQAFTHLGLIDAAHALAQGAG